jgi:hypothetical protein
MTLHKFKLNYIKTKKIPVKIGFRTKDGKIIKFNALKIVEVK